MAHLILPSRFNRQPQGAVEIDSRHDAVDFWLPQSNKTIVGTPSYGYTSQGRVLLLDGSGLNYVRLEKLPLVYSLLYVGRLRSNFSYNEWAHNGRSDSNLGGSYANGNLLFKTHQGTGTFEISGIGTQEFVAAISAQPNTSTNGHRAAVKISNGLIKTGQATTSDYTTWYNTYYVPETSGVRIGGTSTSNIECALCVIFDGAKSLDELYSLAQNPWQVFRKQKQVLYFDAGGGGTSQALESAAAATASATGALTHSVPLAGAAISTATASGAMSISIPLAGAATATASATGGISLSIPLSGAAVAQALAQAGITHAVPLSGSAAGVASATGALSINVSLSGAAIATAAAAADITVETAGSADLAATAAASASASAALSISIPLSGAALTVASAAGGITHIVPLTGSAASASLATGGLDVSVSLNAAALAQALASADLTVQGGLAGDASAVASAAATLTLRVNLDGAALANAIASGALTTAGLIIESTPGFVITRTARPFSIASAPRTWRIAS